jgi:hypothetical protein
MIAGSTVMFRIGRMPYMSRLLQLHDLTQYQLQTPAALPLDVLWY